MLKQSSPEDLSFVGLGIDDAQEQFSIDAKVSVLVQRQILAEDGSLSWRNLRHHYNGTVVGLSGKSDVDPAMRVNVMPENPLPEGAEYASKHPRLIDHTPQVVLDEQMGQVALRYTVVPRIQ